MLALASIIQKGVAPPARIRVITKVPAAAAFSGGIVKVQKVTREV